MEWASGFDSEETSVIDQATYNVLSEMGVAPATPASDITLDSPTEAKPPRPSFTASPSTTSINQSVTFNASASTDPDGDDHRLQVGLRQQRNVRDRHRARPRK